ncbi:hypothetical protein SLEP1_g48144 [Rubroshorea leprosula]|uniref:INO80 complex subunit B-like conserved region domain-containing protein n=1 Tax=Rubroshorea leprosula TaxID=152421 RepID=A0AAV5LUL5_9ROSI|nr:hypothetical protein SLEP1_g48144 [Rubroshorea leprosula]
MEEFVGINTAVRKRRSRTSRRPRPESQPFSESCDHSPLSSATPSDDAGKVSSDENADYDTNHKRKEFSLNQCVSLFSSAVGVEGEKLRKESKERDGEFNAFYNNDPGRSGSNSKRSSEGVLAPANWKSMSKVTEGLESESRDAGIYGERNDEGPIPTQRGTLDGSVNESKIKKLKVKVGGVPHMIHANSAANGMPGSGASTNKSSLQRNKDDWLSPQDKSTGLQGIPWKDFSRGGFGFGPGKEDSLMGKRSGKNISGKQGDQASAVRKSTRVPKRRVLDGEFGEDDEDGEIRYLEKLKTSKINLAYKEDGEESGKKQQKFSRVSDVDNLGTSRSGKDGKKKPRSERGSEDTDTEEEDELVSDSELGGKRKSKQKKESIDALMENKREVTLTTRQRALQSSKEASAAPGASVIEFPNGLPPAPPRKQKEKLTEVEQQLKKAEAAQRRRMQVEKANMESEAEAIRKILGQDSNRKKREEKMKRRQEELAQEKAANAQILAANTVRWVMGPRGTVVTFSPEMGLPSIFDSKPISYPPPREKCASPSCTNTYKYRDSKTKLPLCSLQCYKAIQKQQQTEATS